MEHGTKTTFARSECAKAYFLLHPRYNNRGDLSKQTPDKIGTGLGSESTDSIRYDDFNDPRNETLQKVSRLARFAWGLRFFWDEIFDKDVSNYQGALGELVLAGLKAEIEHNWRNGAVPIVPAAETLSSN